MPSAAHSALLAGGPAGPVPTPNRVPSASFTTSANYLNVACDGSGSSDSDGSIVSWSWNFGDGVTAGGVSVSHSYAGAGTYTITLDVRDDDGAQASTTRTLTLSAPPVPNSGPAASFTASASDLTASFNGSGSSDSDGSIAAYAWNFGDGGTGSGVTTSHTYAAGGAYTVTLTVRDDDGATNVTSRTVTVTAPKGIQNSQRFNMAGSTGVFIDEAKQDEPSYILQSFAVDSPRSTVYFVADPPDSTSGNLSITRTNNAGTITGSMTLKGFGHGVSMAVDKDPSDGKIYLYTETNARSSGYGATCGRFPFVNGQTLSKTASQIQDRTPNLSDLTTNPQPNIDPFYGHYLVRYKKSNGAAMLAVFDIDDMRNDNLNASSLIVKVPLPSRDPDDPKSVFQGFCAYGRYAYLLEGPMDETSYITTIDLKNNGAIIEDRFATRAVASYSNREPEGMGMQEYNGNPRLLFGFKSSASGIHYATLVYKGSLI